MLGEQPGVVGEFREIPAKLHINADSKGMVVKTCKHRRSFSVLKHNTGEWLRASPAVQSAALSERLH